MENHRAVKLLASSLVGAFLMLPLLAHAYSPETTHAGLTQEIIKLFNHHHPNQALTEEQKQAVIQGSIAEDDGLRMLYHFYDPVYQRGLVLGGIWASSKAWGSTASLQARYDPDYVSGLGTVTRSAFSATTDYSWERAVYEYAWGDKNRGLQSLGHILHLIEDASVPDHTRNDPHPHVFEQGSPYEDWTSQFDQVSIRVFDTIKDRVPPKLPSISAYFDRTAQYSNNNFFSKDTIISASYQNPRILEEKVDTTQAGYQYRFGYTTDNLGNRYRLVKIERQVGKIKPLFSIIDPDNLILSDYWSLLSRQAVLNGAGVVKLFFDEAEHEKQTKILYEKNRSWLARAIDRFKQNAFAAAGALYGSSVTLADIEENGTAPKPAEQSASIAPAPVRAAAPPITTNVPRVVPPPSTAVEPPAPSPQIISNETHDIAAEDPPPSSSDETSRSHGNVPDEIIAQSRAALAVAEATDTSSAGASTTVSTPTPAGDTTPPSVSLSVAECSTSLSPAACLLATTTLTISWSSASSDISFYSVSCTSSGAPCAGFSFASTTATSTIYTVPSDNADYVFSASARDTTGNESTAVSQAVSLHTRPIVINEVAWAGTSAARAEDEWLELYNPTNSSVSLDGWVLRAEGDNTPYISLSGLIPAKSFFVLERTDDTTVSDTSPGMIYTGSLSNSGEQLVLSYGSTTIDQTPEASACAGWCGRVSGTYRTMERIDSDTSGSAADNWTGFAGLPANGTNADGLAVEGTPGRRNSVDYVPPAIAGGANITLLKTKSPYIISGEYTVPQTATLTIEPGVAVKFDNASSLKVNGTLSAQGTAAEPIVFTSLHDDDCGLPGGCGDTNATTTAPAAGDWMSVYVTASAVSSVISHAVIRYGGATAPSGDYAANIWIKNSDTAVRDSTIEHSEAYGIKMESATGGTVASNAIRENGMAGLGMYTASSPSVENNTFTENTTAAIDVVSSYPTFSGNTAEDNGINGIQTKLVLDRNYTLSRDLPYYMIEDGSIAPGSTLAIPAGVILKFDPGATFTVNGALIAEGTSANTVIFTSFKDDIAGGDTNGDGAASTPAAGDWKNITFAQNLATSTLAYTAVRYGGSTQAASPQGVLRAVHASITIDHATIEHNYGRGLALEYSTSTVISNSIIQNHQGGVSGTFYGLHLSNSATPGIASTQFRLNDEHIFWDGTSTTTDLGGNTFD